MSNNVYGIDLGTNNFKVYSKATGKTMLEKNTIAVIDKNQIYAYGDSAYAMYEKAPETINVIFPVVEGVIADYNLLQTMIFDFLEHKTKARIKNAEFIIAVPTDITDVEKRAFYELFYKSKSKPKKVMLCEKPIADAVGLGIDVNEPTGVMIVDMGADTTETSVISLGGLVLSDLLHFGVSMPTVLSNVNELIDRNMVIEIGEYESTGGRKAKRIGINPAYKYAVGVVITANHLGIVLLNMQYEIEKTIRIHYTDKHGKIN